MTRRAGKIISALLTLLLMLAPMDVMYASQEYNCDSLESVDNQGHEHSSETLGHHDKQQAEQYSSNSNKCASCGDKQCCCDSSNCSCVMMHNVFVQLFSSFGFSSNMVPSSIPFVAVYHVSPVPTSILRPPIA